MNMIRTWLKGIGVNHRTPAGRRKSTLRLGYRPRLEQLEDRCLLAGNLPWPITPAGGQPLTLLSTYGQYYGTAGGLHFHEGIDVIAAADTAVFAIEAGRVAAVSPVGAAPSASYIAITTTETTHGWNYIHTVPLTNRATGARWAVGDNVRQGDQLGRVGSFAGIPGVTFPDHLHLDYTSNMMDPNYPVLRPIDDPLNHLTALNYTVNPTVNPDVHFRLAADDVNGATTPPQRGRHVLRNGSEEPPLLHDDQRQRLQDPRGASTGPGRGRHRRRTPRCYQRQYRHHRRRLRPASDRGESHRPAQRLVLGHRQHLGRQNRRPQPVPLQRGIPRRGPELPGLPHVELRAHGV